MSETEEIKIHIVDDLRKELDEYPINVLLGQLVLVTKTKDDQIMITFKVDFEKDTDMNDVMRDLNEIIDSYCGVIILEEIMERIRWAKCNLGDGLIRLYTDSSTARWSDRTSMIDTSENIKNCFLVRSVLKNIGINLDKHHGYISKNDNTIRIIETIDGRENDENLLYCLLGLIDKMVIISLCFWGI